MVLVYGLRLERRRYRECGRIFAPMQALKQRILAEGRNLGGGILKIDSILNHQLDAGLMQEMGQELARRFAGAGGGADIDGGNIRDRAGADDGAGTGGAGGVCTEAHAGDDVGPGVRGNGAEPHEGRGGEPDGIGGVSAPPGKMC